MSTPVSYPDDRRPFVSFDATVPNRLVNDGEASANVIARIRERVHLSLNGLSVEELISTPNGARREALFRCYESLISGNEEHSDCLMVQYHLIEALIHVHYKNPWSFDWQKVGVLDKRYLDEIIKRQHVMDDALAKEQRELMARLAKQHKDILQGAREEVGASFSAQNRERPLTFRESLALSNGGSRKVILTLGKVFYDGVTGSSASREKIREFIAECPPFRALLYAIQMAEYEHAIRDQQEGERFRAGRNDLYMAIYLPYCDLFVTDEKHGEQGKCLKEIASVAGLSTEILTFDEFSAGLMLMNAGRS